MTSLLRGLAAERERLAAVAAHLDEVWTALDTTPDVGGATRAGAPGRDRGLVETDLARLRAELDRQRFTIGVFGLVKRGKSTLLNALLGDLVSPMRVTPETAVPVYVDHGDEVAVTVHLADGSDLSLDPDEAAQYTSQEHNENNRRGVTHVRWQLPSPMLEHGVRLVDTPGLDDAQADELYTARTIQELDAVDVGIVVFLSPPTVGATEMAFLREVAARDLDKVILVANLYPQHYDDAETREAVVTYVRDMVAEHTGAEQVRVLPVCAEAAWNARTQDDHETFAASGVADLLVEVERTIEEHAGRTALRRAGEELRTITSVARSEVELRLQFLRDRHALDEHRDRVRSHVAELEAEVARPVDVHLRDLDGLRTHHRTYLDQLFFRARHEIGEAGSVDELESLLSRFTREVEVRTEDTYRVLREKLSILEQELQVALDHRISATLVDLGAVLPASRLPSPTRDARGPWRGSRVASSAGSAAIGGIVAGGAGVALVGALLGPLGLVGGALLGWRLGDVLRSNRAVAKLREDVDERIVQVGQELVEELDRRIDALAEAARNLTDERRAAFTTDLRQVLEVIDELAEDACVRAEGLVRWQHLLGELYRIEEDLEDLTGDDSIARVIRVSLLDEPAVL